MARTPSAKIIEWGTPPMPEPTGWEAIAIELSNRPGEWANIGAFTAATARKIGNERFTVADGFETRAVAGKDGKSAVWVRKVTDAAPADDDAADAVETRAQTDPPAPSKPRTAKRGGVV